MERLLKAGLINFQKTVNNVGHFQKKMIRA